MISAELKMKFHEIYGKEAAFNFFCPGRVNLIGEHIDYNGGNVMPCAITMGTTVLIAKNDTGHFNFSAVNFPETAAIAIAPSYTKRGSDWYNYPLGVIQELTQKGVALEGMDFLFYGNLPIGAGVSSSASIEVLTAYALNSIYHAGLSNIDIALLAKRVENNFMGLNSGIMDQFAVAMGKENFAILLNCDTLEYEYLPFEIGDHVLAIVNTNKPRKLVESKYNERFGECREALKLLQQELDITHLCEIDSVQFAANKQLIQDDILINRAFHVVSENERVHEARQVLTEGNVKRFGELMYASHESLRNLYEVSGVELDTIVDFCKTYAGCIGARMTGAGFGGCAIALVKKDTLEDFATGITQYYTNKIGYAPGVFASEIGDGVRAV